MSKGSDRWPLNSGRINCIGVNPSSEANGSSASTEINRVLWDTKKYYHFHNIPLQGPILSQMNPLHSPPILNI